MKQHTDTAVILSRINYGEADRIVTALTKNAGKITLMAKGARKQKSKLAGGIELFSENEITYAEGKKGMGTLVSSRMRNLYDTIVKRYEVSQDMFAILTWLNTHLEDGTGSEYYRLVIESLHIADHDRLHSDFAYVWFFVRALELSGHGIEVFRGSDGEKLSAAEAYSFDHDLACFGVSENGIYAQNHIKLLRILTSVEIDQFVQIAVDAETTVGVRHLIERHVQLNS